ncbi:exotoxin OB-fold domain-containing protein [Staphylococcus aureus]|uniref:exotoxin OB-fold domain-containing protein n=1 Tax=Staphylococcus aureus TaxID=1280 RepID=UPI00397CF72A
MKLFAFIFICVKSCSLLFMLNGNPKPEQLNKASEFTGLMDNMRYLYDDKHVSETNIKSQEKFLQHDLLFKINGSKILKTEFNNKSLSDKYKNKNVDLFGTNYYNQCYFSSDNMELNDGRLIEKTCMYGGVTEHDGNQIDKNNSTDNSHIDYKVRNYLLKHKNLYEFNSSPYETGYIKFIEGSGHSFWYDLMPESGKKFYPTKYLLIYNDNKTVESKSINVEVHLTKK